MISKNHIKHIQLLHSKKHREEESLFIVEGIKVVSEFINSDSFLVEEVLALPEFIDKHKTVLTNKQIKFSEISEDELKKISTQQSPNQVLAIVNSKNLTNLRDVSNELSLFLDDIRDPGNLGTIIRIADWFGIKEVFCSKQCTELYNPKTIQATMGAILRVNVNYVDFLDLKAKNPTTAIYGAVLKGETIYTSQLKNGIIIIGNEANGISDEVLKLVSHPITIPSSANNGSESLNAANACAIICSEFHRQLNFK